ncbi:dTDP-4-dehydrorhamnose reductase [Flavobacterium sp. NST-5]|uniref:dTDP-4-dehydrorhamnose reductase n=1 Tax=Flavobacterium ichthyis TaxID=2698827 RepID=A0ABW9Z7F5_9FLAO|nr:dTDP-4-dehydrorhamnose reductase [Flavobacterium ichthyis]NBL64808.1 dTDP-4-dehydrorhamnose reductase [Flavobacterium ichthyis]
MKKILVTGANGQLGSEINAISRNLSGYEFVFATRENFSLEDSFYISEYLEHLQPDIIINCAAYTAVDKAETDKAAAEAVNHTAVEAMAKYCFKKNSNLLHISTDYVFNGNSAKALDENAAVAPINFYGESKLRGEEAAMRENPTSIIIRTAWVYSEFGNNFVKTMMKLMNERDSLNIVNDQIGSPTYAGDLAKAILKIIDSGVWHPGMYHYSNKGEISWYDFAKDIKELANLNCELTGIPTTAYPTPAKRPAFSLLNTKKISETYQVEIPFYKDSLQKVIQKLQSNKN